LGCHGYYVDYTLALFNSSALAGLERPPSSAGPPCWQTGRQARRRRSAGHFPRRRRRSCQSQQMGPKQHRPPGSLPGRKSAPELQASRHYARADVKHSPQTQPIDQRRDSLNQPMPIMCRLKTVRVLNAVGISAIIGPQSISQTPMPPPSPLFRMDPVESSILAALQQSGRYGMETWTLLNKIATAQNPTSRSERRAIRLQAWRALESLLHQRQVFRVGRKCVSLTKLPPVSARRRGCLRQGSTFGQEVMAETQKSANHKPQTWLKENLARPATPTLSPETKSAPSQEEISAAARALATRPPYPKTPGRLRRRPARLPRPGGYVARRGTSLPLGGPPWARRRHLGQRQADGWIWRRAAALVRAASQGD
jgi:hypothetical protein